MNAWSYEYYSLRPHGPAAGRRFALRSYEAGPVHAEGGTKRSGPWDLGRGRVLGVEYQGPIGGECQCSLS